MIYIIEPSDHPIVGELRNLLIQHDPAVLLKKYTGRDVELKEYKVINQRIGKNATWLSGEGAAVDFSQGANYVWLCVCHEMAHVFLWGPPGWNENEEIKKQLERHENYVSTDKHYHEYGYDFRYAIEQTMAFMLQAACESQSGLLRPLDWNKWEETFEYNGVLDLAKVFWEPWKKYLKTLDQYSNIDTFILNVLANF